MFDRLNFCCIFFEFEHGARNSIVIIQKNHTYPPSCVANFIAFQSAVNVRNKRGSQCARMSTKVTQYYTVQLNELNELN